MLNRPANEAITAEKRRHPILYRTQHIVTTIKYCTTCSDFLAVEQSVFHKPGDEIPMRGTATQAKARTIARGKDVVDSSVKNPRGEDLGSIKDVMIDINEGCIAYAALSFGGIMGLGDKLFAIPWAALQYNAADDYFVLDVPRDQLENAPGFDKNNWPTTAEREWLTRMYSHYGYPPYWEHHSGR